MLTLDPLITLSITGDATRFAFSNFIHRFGSIPDGRYIQETVGIPKRVFICNIRNLPKKTSTIVISHLHPTLGNHSADGINNIGKIINLCWQITLLISEMATTIASLAIPNASKEDIIDHICTCCMVDSDMLNPSLAILFNQLQNAKNEYYEVRVISEKARNSISIKHEALKHISANPLTRKKNVMHSAGMAFGKSGSAERISQAQELWNENRLNLGLQFGYDKKDEWSNWFMNIKEGKYLMASALSELSRKYINMINRLNMTNYYFWLLVNTEITKLLKDFAQWHMINLMMNGCMTKTWSKKQTYAGITL